MDKCRANAKVLLRQWENAEVMQRILLRQLENAAEVMHRVWIIRGPIQTGFT
jgi:hypothetical protein